MLRLIWVFSTEASYGAAMGGGNVRWDGRGQERIASTWRRGKFWMCASCALTCSLCLLSAGTCLSPWLRAAGRSWKSRPGRASHGAHQQWSPALNLFRGTSSLSSRLSPKHLFDSFLKFAHPSLTECACREENWMQTALESRASAPGPFVEQWNLMVSGAKDTYHSSFHVTLQALSFNIFNIFSATKEFIHITPLGERGFHSSNFSISRNLRNWAVELLLST